MTTQIHIGKLTSRVESINLLLSQSRATSSTSPTMTDMRTTLPPYSCTFFANKFNFVFLNGVGRPFNRWRPVGSASSSDSYQELLGWTRFNSIIRIPDRFFLRRWLTNVMFGIGSLFIHCFVVIVMAANKWIMLQNLTPCVDWCDRRIHPIIRSVNLPVNDWCCTLYLLHGSCVLVLTGNYAAIAEPRYEQQRLDPI